MSEAARHADNAPDDFERAKAFLPLSRVGDAAGESARTAWLESAVKALNRVPRPDPGAVDKEPYEQYLRALDNTGYQPAKGFREATTGDEAGALSLSEKL